MRMALLVKNKLGFIEGTCLKSSYKGELSSIIYASNAKTIWKEFKERFDKSNLTRSYFLWIQIGSLKQVGLNESYSQVRSQILLKTPVLTVNQAYALVIEEESHRELSALEITRELLTMMARQNQGYKAKKIGIGLYNGKVMGIGRENCGLYILKWRDNPVAALVTKDTDECSLWHIRLGHPSIMAMNHIFALKNKVVDSLQHNCEVCPLAKQSRLKFPLSGSKIECIFQLIHLDVWGSHKLPTYYRKHYFLTIMDAFSRYTWVCLLQSKCEVVTVLKDFLIMVKTQFDMNVKVLRSDNGREFFNSSFNELLASLGIVHQSSCPYTPQVVERKHIHILEVARALQFQSYVPSKFWGDSIKTIIYLINMWPTPILQGKSPYEVLYNKTPVIDHLKVFGCLCFSSNLPNGDKFAKRARKLVLIVTKNTNTPITNVQHLDHKDQNIETTEVEHDKQDTYTDLVPNTESEINVTPDNSIPVIRSDQEPRKTTTTSKPPVWLKDYQTTQKFSSQCLYLLTDTLTYANLTAGYHTYLQVFSAEVKPTTFQQASTDSRWVTTMQQEIQALENNHIWEIVDLPAGKQAISSKWVYKIKYKANGEV
ncbi:uncharacterized protein LOC142177578 [Nicotiana tabacum]|uniref:Uncharacterized protein LOC142177578 n=1 Tax=Nicotiana tabacum TaxID=4097 RepID=A0AC58U032_TOBAC